MRVGSIRFNVLNSDEYIAATCKFDVELKYDPLFGLHSLHVEGGLPALDRIKDVINKLLEVV